MKKNSKQFNLGNTVNSNNTGITSSVPQQLKNYPSSQTTTMYTSQPQRQNGGITSSNKNNSNQMSSILNSNNNMTVNQPQYYNPSTSSNYNNNLPKQTQITNNTNSYQKQNQEASSFSSPSYYYNISSQNLQNNQYNNISDKTQNNQTNYKFLSDVGDLRAKNQIEQQQKILSYEQPKQQQTQDTYNREGISQYQSGKGIVGLRNIGNTCFMNSVLQCLANTPNFNDSLLGELSSFNKSGVANAYANFIRNYRKANNNTAENPSELKRAIEKNSPQFSGYSQQDAQELMIELLESINQEMNRAKSKPVYKEMSDQLDNKNLIQLSQEWWEYQKKRENSVVQDFFAGQVLNKVSCNQCNSSAFAFDNFSDVSLAITRSLSMLDDFNIERLIEQFLKEEIIDDYYCKKCKCLKKSKRQFYFFRLPQILVFQIKRFNFRRFGSDKLNHKITFPIKGLDMYKYLDLEKQKSSSSQYQYELFGVVNHSGTISGGHYTADCKSIVDGQWYRFNDSLVTPINIDSQPYKTGGSSSPQVISSPNKTIQD